MEELLRRALGFGLFDSGQHLGNQHSKDDDEDKDNKRIRAMIRQRRRDVDARRRCGGSSGDASTFVTFDHGSRNTKPPEFRSRSPEALASLLPVHVRSLQVNTTHRGRLLRGTIVELPVLMRSIQFLLQDEQGRIAMVSIYNWAGIFPGSPLDMRWAAMDQHFKPGAHLAIVEPYYKIQQDGTPGIRVDNPQEDVIWLERLGPADNNEWQQEGGKHFRARQYDEAIHCYEKALETQISRGDHLVLKLILNASNCCLQLGRARPAAQWAAVAAVSMPSAPPALAAKAWYRLGASLERLGHADLAKPATAHSKAISASTKEQHRLQKLAPSALKQSLVKALSVSPLSDQEELRSDHGPSETGEAVDEALAKGKRCRDEGNVLFGQGMKAEALDAYLAGLAACRGSIPVLLTNMAQCHLSLGSFEFAAATASAALALDQHLPKAHYRRALALLNLESLSAAEAACKYGLAVAAENEHQALRDLEKRIASAKKASADFPAVSSTAQANPDHYMHNLQDSKKDTMPVEMISFMNSMFHSVMKHSDKPLPKELKYLALDERVPPLHDEFSRLGCWPPQCNPETGYRILQLAYEGARTASHARMRLTPEGREPADIAKRLGSVSPAAVNWWFEADIFECRMRADDAPRYAEAFRTGGDGENTPVHQLEMCHSFGNTPAAPEILHEGTTHVAVGFNDLTTLIYADVRPPPSGRAPGPLRWEGFEMSAYACAKTRVIAEMLSSGSETTSVLQAWFSAAWTNATQMAFREALAKVLSSSSTVISPAVHKILAYWQVHDVPLREARRLIQDDIRDTGSSNYDIANWRKRADRLALSRYILTRELLEGDVGSTVMFGIPPGMNLMRPSGENFLTTIPPEELIAARESAGDAIEAGIHVLTRRIEQLRRRMMLGSVKVTIHHEAVELPRKTRTSSSPADGQPLGAQTSVHARIAAMEPYTISWSNVLDYMSPSVFHTLAQACSAKADTLHYGCSMNWPQQIKGGYIMDFVDRGQEAVDDLLERAKRGIALLYEDMGLKKWLLSPPVDIPLNIGDYATFMLAHKHWVKKFFSLADGHCQVGKAYLMPYTVWAGGSSTIWLTWTYDKEISFRKEEPM